MLTKLPEHLDAEIRCLVTKDIAPDPMTVHAKLGTAVILGGLLSLFICGQFGMGATSWAEAFSHRLHETMPPLLCASACGTLFSIMPTLLLRIVLCSALQFRTILGKHFLKVGAWYGTAGLVLASYGHHGQGLIEIFIWCVSAILTCYLIAMVMRTLLPAWSLLPSRWKSAP